MMIMVSRNFKRIKQNHKSLQIYKSENKKNLFLATSTVVGSEWWLVASGCWWRAWWLAMRI
jgi:hypothetical protein